MKTSAHRRLASDKKLFACFLIVLAAGMTFQLYKAGSAGIIYDESFTLSYFGGSIHDALTLYMKPNNNHVVNSILICIAGKFFSAYEHYIRIPSTLFGILFSLSIAYIIFRTVHSEALRILLLALIIWNWFVFDLSYLARGYSIALGAIYAGIAVGVALLNNRTHERSGWLAIPAIVLMNFLAAGSMLSCLPTLFGVNFVFIFLFSPHFFRKPGNRFKIISIQAVSVFVLSSISLFLLYQHIYKDILKARHLFEIFPFTVHVKEVLVDSLIGQGQTFSVIVFFAYSLLILVSLIFFIYNRPKSKPKNHDNRDRSGDFVMALAIAVFGVTFFYKTVLKIPLGYMRNGVFLLPIVLLGTGVLVDRFWRSLPKGKFSTLIIRSTIVVISLLLITQNLPSAWAVEIQDWDRQSISGPLVHRLKQIDPRRVWKIKLTKDTRYLRRSLYYYLQFGYKVKVQNSPDWDITVFYKTDRPPGAIYLDETFFKKYNCYVATNPKKQKAIYKEQNSRAKSVRFPED